MLQDTTKYDSTSLSNLSLVAIELPRKLDGNERNDLTNATKWYSVGWALKDLSLETKILQKKKAAVI